MSKLGSYYKSGIFNKSLIITLVLLFQIATGAADASETIIRLATTTSTENSGLLRYLLPQYEKETGHKVHVIAVGTGKALRMGQDGDVDVVLVHAPKSEQAFVDAGYGEKRFDVMYNDFVIVGAANNPAKISSTDDITAVMGKIHQSKAVFVSRGDDSGTHKKELNLWKTAGINPKGNRYREAGQGMGKVLQIASELDAYTLTDRGTWLAYQNKSPLKIAFQGDNNLFNPYSIIAVNPKLHSYTNYKGAMSLIKWITSIKGQQMISDFRIADTQLFKPSANKAHASK